MWKVEERLELCSNLPRNTSSQTMAHSFLVGLHHMSAIPNSNNQSVIIIIDEVDLICFLVCFTLWRGMNKLETVSLQPPCLMQCIYTTSHVFRAFGSWIGDHPTPKNQDSEQVASKFNDVFLIQFIKFLYPKHFYLLAPRTTTCTFWESTRSIPKKKEK